MQTFLLYGVAYDPSKNFSLQNHEESCLQKPVVFELQNKYAYQFTIRCTNVTDRQEGFSHHHVVIGRGKAYPCIQACLPQGLTLRYSSYQRQSRLRGD